MVNAMLRVLLCIAIFTMGIAESLASGTHPKIYDGFGIGHSQADLITFVSEDYIKRNLRIPYGIEKGSIFFADQVTWSVLHGSVETFSLRPSGDVAILMMIYSMLGGKCDLETLVVNDDYGKRNLKMMQNSGLYVNHNIDPMRNAQTVTRMVYVAPDGKITTVVKSVEQIKLTQKHIRYHALKDYKDLVIDVSMWDDGMQSQAIMRALKAAKHMGTRVVAIMPNGNFIKQYRRQLIDLLPHLDILILHERSMIPFFLTKDNEDIVKIAKKHGIMIVYTQGARGATLITPTEVLSLSAHDVPQSKIIDKSGAQAAFAAGLLYSLNQGFSLQEAGNNGILLAEYVLQHVDYELVDEDVLYALSRKNKENSQ